MQECAPYSTWLQIDIRHLIAGTFNIFNILNISYISHISCFSNILFSVIGTLYCAKGNFEFGISRIIKVS